jgi:hypothetical protein
VSSPALEVTSMTASRCKEIARIMATSKSSELRDARNKVFGKYSRKWGFVSLF